MSGRPHSVRLLFDLAEIREELNKEAGSIADDELDWTPAPGMKSYRSLLAEIGCVEAENLSLIQTGVADYKPTEAILRDPILGTARLLEELGELRKKTLSYLEQVSEEALQVPLNLPEDWYQFFGGETKVEPEELIRWITRHEYYHLGQIITMRWIQGHNPYKPTQ